MLTQISQPVGEAAAAVGAGERLYRRLSSAESPCLGILDPSTGNMVRHSTADLHALACRWSIAFEAVGGDVVPISGRTTLNAIAAFVGAIYAGKQPTFVSYPSTKISGEEYQRKLENYFQRFGTRVVAGDERDRELSTEAICCPENDGSASVRQPKSRGLHETLFVQCSSGTTGLQKAVGISGAQLLSQVEQYRAALDLGPSDRIVSWLPLYHDMGLIATMLLPLLAGVEVIYIDVFDWLANPESYLALLESERATFTWLPNFAFSYLSRAHA